jgi:uncharacterized repeat protein (TIGR01451 family)
MIRAHSSALPWHRPAFAVAALAGPLIALSPYLTSASLGSHSGHPGPGSSATSTPGPAAVIRAAAKKPALSIGISDGRQTARPGMLLSYTIQIHNIGRIGVPRLNVEQMVPPGLKLISVSRHGVRRAGQVSWQLNLPPGQAATFRIVARVGKTPKQTLRLATVACASAGAHGRPIVCATDSDQLPAGAIAAAHVGQASPGRGHLRPVSIVLAAVVVVVAAAGAWWVAIRRRRASHLPTAPQ